MEITDTTTITLDEGGVVRVGAVVLSSGGIRYTLSAAPAMTLTRSDAATIAGELLRRSHPPVLPVEAAPVHEDVTTA